MDSTMRWVRKASIRWATRQAKHSRRMYEMWEENFSNEPKYVEARCAAVLKKRKAMWKEMGI